MHDLRVAVPLILGDLRGPRAEYDDGRLRSEFQEDSKKLVEVRLVYEVTG
jgi:hypothetical protein